MDYITSSLFSILSAAGSFQVNDIFTDSRIFVLAMAILVGMAIWWLVLVYSLESQRRTEFARNTRRASLSRAPATMTEADIAQRLAPTVQLTGLQQSFLPLFERILKIARFDRADVARRLYRAGRRNRDAMAKYIVKRGFFMVAAPVLAWAMAPSLGIDGMLLVPFLIGWSFGGGIVVDSQLDRESKARLGRIRTQFPFFLDVMVIYLDAGAAFDSALEKSETSLRSSFPDIALDIRDLRASLDQAIDRQRAFVEYGKAAGIEDVRTFVSIVLQSERVGNPVVPSLRTLSRESKKNAVFEIEMKAQKLPTMMQLPMFLFILPAIFMSVTTPAVLRIGEAFSGM